MKLENDEIFAAISLALHEYKGNNVHDVESGMITIAERGSEWNSHTISMTEQPQQKF